MLGRSAIVGTTNSLSNGRVFVYEVTGLRQNTENDGNNYSFRSSGSVFIKVPYRRMNEEMQRIARMGGTIASIKPLGAGTSSEGGKPSSEGGKPSSEEGKPSSD